MDEIELIKVLFPRFLIISVLLAGVMMLVSDTMEAKNALEQFSNSRLAFHDSQDRIYDCLKMKKISAVNERPLVILDEIKYFKNPAVVDDCIVPCIFVHQLPRSCFDEADGVVLSGNLSRYKPKHQIWISLNVSAKHPQLDLTASANPGGDIWLGSFGFQGSVPEFTEVSILLDSAASTRADNIIVIGELMAYHRSMIVDEKAAFCFVFDEDGMVTLKFFRCLEKNSIPIYFGPKEIIHFAPNNRSFVNGRHFRRGQELVGFLKHLLENDFKEYHKWRSDLSYRTTGFQKMQDLLKVGERCRICTLVKRSRLALESTSESHFRVPF